ncbi:MAG TPA: DUF3014 domain-containing protein [Burkholderiales bacterium]|nr:DUF3014 domain-containing protein [Burkholderiales bacterium]
MEQKPVEGERPHAGPEPDERPYLRPEPGTFPWIEAALAIALAAGTIYLFYYFQAGRDAPPAPAAKSAAAPSPQAEAPPPIRNPLPDSDAKLPTLANSDSLMRESLVELIGRKAFEDFIVPDRLIPRIVATVDNLPRRSTPRRLMPLHPVSGPFIIAGAGEQLTLDPTNYRRYTPYVRVLEAAPARTVVSLYVQTYPLFQRAYEELGYGSGYFNDRLVEAIDDLLAAPEINAPIGLMQPKVYYEFTDPDLETRSAGQKMLIRMGAENARRVKAKLAEIRQALAQPAAAAPP